MFFGEVVAGASLLFFCWIIGLPVSLAIAASDRDQHVRLQVGGLAPAFGLALLSVVVVGCYMFFGPTKNWAAISAIVLSLAAAGGLSALLVTRRRLLVPFVPALLTALLASLVIFAIWAVPQVISGPDATFIRSNPSDTMMYVSLSESTRVAGLQQIIDGRGIADIPPTIALLEENAFALYSARMVGGVMRLGTFNLVGWTSELTGLGVENLLWIFGAVCAGCLAAATYAVSRLLGGSYLASIAASAAATLGYWIAATADADAFSGLHILPIAMALVGVMALLSERLAFERTDQSSRPKLAWITRALVCGFLLGAILISYIEMGPFVLLALFATCAVWTIQSRISWRPAAAASIVVATALGVVIASGQLLYLSAILTRQVSFALGASGAIGSFATDSALFENPVSGFAGLSWLDSLLRSMRVSQPVASLAEWLATLLTIGFVVGVGLASLLPKMARVTFPAALAAVLVSAGAYGFFGKGDTYWVLKTMSFAAPFIVVLVATATPAFLAVSTSKLGVAATTIASATCLTIIATFGVGRLIDDLGQRVPLHTAKVHQGRNYDISKVVAELDRRCPCALVVHLPPQNDWWRAMYFAKTLQRFQPFQQMGVFFDNGAKTLSVSKLNQVGVPDYVVVSEEDDYIAESNLGDLIVEQAGVRLYAIVSGSATDFGPREMAK